MTHAVPTTIAPHSTSLPPARRVVTSAFRSLLWCNALIPLSSLSGPTTSSIGTVLNPWDSCCANKDCSPHYFSSTSQETGHICIPQPSVMQSSYSSLLPLRTGSNLHWHTVEPIGLLLCQQRLLPTVLFFHKPGDWPHLHSAAFRDAILWAHRTRAVLPLTINSNAFGNAFLWAHGTRAVAPLRNHSNAFRNAFLWAHRTQAIPTLTIHSNAAHIEIWNGWYVSETPYITLYTLLYIYGQLLSSCLSSSLWYAV